MKFNSTKKILILFSIILVVLLSLHFVVFSFIRTSALKVTELELDVVNLRNQVAEFSKYNPDDLVLLARSIVNRFISRDNIGDFIENIEKQARAQNVSVSIKSVDAETNDEDEKKDKQSIRIRFETRGSWNNVMKFVSFIEHLPYKIELQSLGLSTVPGAEPTKEKQWQGQIEITTLKFK